MDAKRPAKLAPFWTNMTKKLQKLLTKTRYVELDRQLTPSRCSFCVLAYPDLFRKRSSSYLPARSCCTYSHVDTENNGIASIEKIRTCYRLASGEDVTFVDLGLQSVIRSEIQKQIDKFEAIGGAAFIDIKLVKCLLSPLRLQPQPILDSQC